MPAAELMPSLMLVTRILRGLAAVSVAAAVTSAGSVAAYAGQRPGVVRTG